MRLGRWKQASEELLRHRFDDLGHVQQYDLFGLVSRRLQQFRKEQENLLKEENQRRADIRAMKKVETDTTKYWDGRQIDTSRGGVILAPMETFDKGQAVVANNTYWPTHSETTYARKKYTQYSMYSTTSYIAIPFTGTSSYSVKTAYIWAKKIGNGTRTMMAHIVADSAGSPADAVAADKSDSYTFTGNNGQSELIKLTWSTARAVTTGSYWFVIYWSGTAPDPTSTDCIELVCDGAGSGEKISTSGY